MFQIVFTVSFRTMNKYVMACFTVILVKEVLKLDERKYNTGMIADDHFECKLIKLDTVVVSIYFQAALFLASFLKGRTRYAG